jgi:hypothetical protein
MNRAYPVCCQTGNLHMHCPFVYCRAGFKVWAFVTQPDRHGMNMQSPRIFWTAAPSYGKARNGIVFTATILAASVFLLAGCSIIPSHIHNETDAKTALQAQADMADYAKNAPAMYLAMTTNVEKFKVEEEYLLSELARNYKSALITTLPTMTWEHFLSRLTNDLQQITNFETEFSQVASNYVVSQHLANADLNTAEGEIKTVQTAATEAEQDVASWNSYVALLQQGFRNLPTDVGSLKTSTSLSSIQNAAASLGTNRIIYSDANGKPVTNTVSEIVVSQAERIGSGIIAMTGTNASKIKFPNAPGITLQILNLALDLAQLQQKKAQARLNQLDVRATMFEDALAQMLLAHELLLEVSNGVRDGTLSASGKNPYATIMAEWSAANKLTVDQYGSGLWGRVNGVAEVLLYLRKLAIAESIIARNQTLFELDVARLNHEESIANSALSDAAHQALIKSGLDGLVAYHQSGFTEEDAANIIRIGQTVALAVIAGK